MSALPRSGAEIFFRFTTCLHAKGNRNQPRRLMLRGQSEQECFTRYWQFAPRSLPRIRRHARRQFRLDVLVATGALVHHRFERFMDFADRTALHPASLTLVEDRLVGFCGLGQQGRRRGARIVVHFFHEPLGVFGSKKVNEIGFALRQRAAQTAGDAFAVVLQHFGRKHG